MSVEIYPPIGDYALLSDCHSGALVSKDGSIDWCTFHRFEARPVFARILDWAKAGFFRIAPLDDDYESTRRYLPGTNVLETTFRTPTGTLVLTDFFAFRAPGPGKDAHAAHPDHQLIRIARCSDGEVAVKVKLVPRFDYGLTTPRLETLADDLVIVYGAADGLVLQSGLASCQSERCATEGNRTPRAGATAFVAWLKRTTAGRATELQIMYGVGGERLLPEVELDWLEGYRGSRPVRIGNGAAQQFQLDTFGELLDTAWLYRRHGGQIDEIFWDFLSRVGGVVLEKWREPDQGIWEIRGEPQHFVYSKVMAWVALDQLVRLAELDGREADPRWASERDEIRALIERDGVDEASQSFVQY